MNPWWSIWTEPRATISKIVRENPNRDLWILAAIYGFLSLINIFQAFVAGQNLHFATIIILAVVIAPFWGMVVFTIWSWVVYLIGKLLKGKANYTFVRAAFAWSNVPLLINVVLWIILLAVYRNSLFLSAEPSGGPLGLLLIALIVKVIVMIWSLVIYINALAEVQKFSTLRSIGNIVLSWIAVAVVFSILWLLIAYFTNASLSPSQAAFNLTLRMSI